jgi:DNA mismatch endonuclease (patch repair protein)
MSPENVGCGSLNNFALRKKFAVGGRIPGKMDVVDAVTRSRMMSRIKSKNTRPEMTVRKYLHAAGFRYRLHAHHLPGSPDLILPKYGTAIFVHGCFWHRHQGCRYATTPASNAEHWKRKFAANTERDARKERMLHAAGWRVIVVWECELRRAPEERLRQLVEEITATAGHPPSHLR